MSTDCNRADDFLFSQQQESTSGANKYDGLVPKKKPLISKDSKRAFFDSADWALLKQEASIDQRPIAAIEKLRPKFQRTPRKQLPPRRPTCATGHDNLSRAFRVQGKGFAWKLWNAIGLVVVSLLTCFMFP